MKSPDGLYVNEAFGMKSESLLAAGAKSNGSTRLAFGRYCRRGRERYSNRRPPTVSVSVTTMSNDSSPKIAFRSEEHGLTPVNNAHIVFRLLLVQKLRT